MIKILMITPVSIDQHNFKGGVEAAISNLLLGLKNFSDIQIEVLSFNKNINKIIKYSISKSVNVTIYPYKYKFSTLIEIIFNSLREIESRVSIINPDIVHIQGGGYRLLYILVLRKFKILLTPHGFPKQELRNIRRIKSLVNYLLMILIEKTLIKKINNYLFISDFIYKKYLDYFNLKSFNYRVIHNSVNPIYFNYKPKYEISNNLIYVGFINNNKGLLILLQAIKCLKEENYDVNLNVVGVFTDKNYEKQIRRFIEINKLNNNVIFHGWKNHYELSAMLQKMDIFILPSKAENLPVSIAEAMASGKIIISSNVGGISEMIIDKESGLFFDLENYKQLKEKILFALTNKEILSLGKNAHERASCLFHPKEVAYQTYNYYKDLCLNR